jgi:hypothetical protein
MNLRGAFLLAIFVWFSLPGLAESRSNRIEQAWTIISDLRYSLDQYFADTGHYPGAGSPENENAFPALFEALFGERPPQGRGGPRAPYMKFREGDVLIWDGEVKDYRPASAHEIYNPEVKRYLQDPWGKPYVYRLLANPTPLSRFQGKPFIIYSTGRDGIDQTSNGEAGDDLTSWDPVPGSSTAAILTLMAVSACLLLVVWLALRFLRASAGGR